MNERSGSRKQRTKNKNEGKKATEKWKKTKENRERESGG